MAYKTHPYRWPTIGKTMQHVEEATLQDVKDFFYTYYRPNNAVLVIAGAVKTEKVKPLVEKWFDEIQPQARPEAAYPQEAKQQEARRKFVEADVPALAFYRAYPMCGRMDSAYSATDLLSDVLGGGKSSFLFRTLVREKSLFSSFNTYVTGSVDAGLLVLEGKLHEGVSAPEAEATVDALLANFCQQPPEKKALEKVKAQVETGLAFSELPLLNRAYRLAYGATFATPEWAVKEGERLHAVSAEDVFAAAQNVLRPEAANTIWYGKKEDFTAK
jgi:predicted Zn-dependent peptidase